MSHQIKAFAAWLTPAIFWLVRRALLAAGSVVGTAGVANEQAVAALGGLAMIVVSEVLMRLHTRWAKASASYDATHYQRNI